MKNPKCPKCGSFESMADNQKRHIPVYTCLDCKFKWTAYTKVENLQGNESPTCRICASNENTTRSLCGLPWTHYCKNCKIHFFYDDEHFQWSPYPRVVKERDDENLQGNEVPKCPKCGKADKASFHGGYDWFCWKCDAFFSVKRIDEFFGKKPEDENLQRDAIWTLRTPAPDDQLNKLIEFAKKYKDENLQESEIEMSRKEPNPPPIGLKPPPPKGPPSVKDENLQGNEVVGEGLAKKLKDLQDFERKGRESLKGLRIPGWREQAEKPEDENLQGNDFLKPPDTKTLDENLRRKSPGNSVLETEKEQAENLEGENLQGNDFSKYSDATANVFRLAQIVDNLVIMTGINKKAAFDIISKIVKILLVEDYEKFLILKLDWMLDYQILYGEED